MERGGDAFRRYLVPGPPTSSIRTPGFENLLFLNTFSQPQTQNPSGTLRVAHFHRALRPAPDVLAAAAAAAPKKPYGAVHLRLEKDLDEYRAFKRARLGAKTTFDEMENTASLRACAQGVERLFVAVAVDEVANAEDKAYLAQKRGPFDSALAFHGGNLSARFGAAALVVGAMIDMEICADAAYFVSAAARKARSSVFAPPAASMRPRRSATRVSRRLIARSSTSARRGTSGRRASRYLGTVRLPSDAATSASPRARRAASTCTTSRRCRSGGIHPARGRGAAATPRTIQLRAFSSRRPSCVKVKERGLD